MSAPAYNGQGVRGTKPPEAYDIFLFQTAFLTKYSQKLGEFRLNFFSSREGPKSMAKLHGAMAGLAPLGSAPGTVLKRGQIPDLSEVSGCVLQINGNQLVGVECEVYTSRREEKSGCAKTRYNRLLQM